MTTCEAPAPTSYGALPSQCCLWPLHECVCTGDYQCDKWTPNVAAYAVPACDISSLKATFLADPGDSTNMAVRDCTSPSLAGDGDVATDAGRD